MNTDLTKCIAQMITNLNNKYKDDSYMLQRLQLHLTNLPNVLEQEKKRYDERISRFNELSIEHEHFNKVFLSNHQYFYIPYNNNYYEYDGKDYKIIKEDDIHHHLLSTITDEGKLIQWKYKTKQNIIKKIKERHLFKSTPESYTIQKVLNMLSSFFETKTDAKYFLTVVGDYILKKNNDNLLYFVSSNLKKLIVNVDYIVSNTSGTTIANKFITKYHDSHNLTEYRLIKSNETHNLSYLEIVNDSLKNMGLDLICVATHYSDRYLNAETFLNTDVECDKEYVMYFSNHSIDEVVSNFISECVHIVPKSERNEFTISRKQMLNIWKLYLSNNNIPNVIYLNQFQKILMSKLEHTIDVPNSHNITFINVISKYSPNQNIKSFLSFWETHISITDDSSNEYEVDELIKLYKKSENKRNNMLDSDIVKTVIDCFSPEIKVIDNKYVTNIICDLWIKNEDINAFLLNYYENKTVCKDVEIIPFDDFYVAYKEYVNSKKAEDKDKINHLIVSKKYFEDFLKNKLTKYIKYDTFVSSNWELM